MSAANGERVNDKEATGEAARRDVFGDIEHETVVGDTGDTASAADQADEAGTEMAEFFREMRKFAGDPGVNSILDRAASTWERQQDRKRELEAGKQRREERKDRIAGLTYRAALRRGQWLRFVASLAALASFTGLAFWQALSKEFVAAFYVAYLGYIWVEVTNSRKSS